MSATASSEENAPFPRRVLMLGAVNSPHLVHLAARMQGQGFEVHLAGYVYDGLPPVEAQAQGITVHVTPGVTRREGGLPAHVWAVRRLLRDLRPDVVHGHSVVYYCFAAALAGATPLISTAWGSDVYRATRLGVRQIRFALRRSAWATADSPDLVDRLRALGAPAERTSVIGWGVDLRDFAPAVNGRAEIKRQLGLGQGPLILAPRSLASNYNPEIVVAAFTEVRRHMPDARLLLKHIDVGPPPPGLLGEGIDIVGHVPYEQMARYYRAADVCVSIPSSDSAPRSVWEAMASGAPCVLSDLPWVSSMLVARKHVLTTEIEPRAVARAIGAVLSDPALAAALSAAGRQFVEEHEDAELHTQRLADLYRTLARRSA